MLVVNYILFGICPLRIFSVVNLLHLLQTTFGQNTNTKAYPVRASDKACSNKSMGLSQYTDGFTPLFLIGRGEYSGLHFFLFFFLVNGLSHHTLW